MPNYKNKETGEIKRFASVRTKFNTDGSKTDVCLTTGEVLSENWEFVPWDGDFSNVKAKKAFGDGFGSR